MLKYPFLNKFNVFLSFEKTTFYTYEDLLNCTNKSENGEIVVALIDRENATVKTFYKENGHFRLQPENDSFEPIITDEVIILGKVVGLMRYF